MRCSDCCCEDGVSADQACPQCGQRGAAVPDETVAALLTPKAGKRRGPDAYYFCETADCPIVYYSADGRSRFEKSDVRVRVGIKETTPPRPLCYCFGHTYEAIRDEWEQTGESASLRAIEAATKSGTCRCGLNNPSGGCCLPEVRRFLAELKGSDR